MINSIIEIITRIEVVVVIGSLTIPRDLKNILPSLETKPSTRKYTTAKKSAVKNGDLTSDILNILAWLNHINKVCNNIITNAYNITANIFITLY